MELLEEDVEEVNLLIFGLFLIFSLLFWLVIVIVEIGVGIDFFCEGKFALLGVIIFKEDVVFVITEEVLDVEVFVFKGFEEVVGVGILVLVGFFWEFERF